MKEETALLEMQPDGTEVNSSSSFSSARSLTRSLFLKDGA
jgi:hypothetical protein